MFTKIIVFVSLIVSILGHITTHGKSGSSNINIYMTGSTADPGQATEGCPKQGREIVAFSVGRKSDFQPTSESRIPMDHVLVNHGGHFDTNSSVFTAPQSGIYVFFYSGAANPGTVTTVTLKTGAVGAEKDVGMAFNNAKDQHNFASGSVMVAMEMGETASVWINANSMVYGRVPPRTQFYGYLLAPLE